MVSNDKYNKNLQQNLAETLRIYYPELDGNMSTTAMMALTTTKSIFDVMKFRQSELDMGYEPTLKEQRALFDYNRRLENQNKRVYSTLPINVYSDKSIVSQPISTQPIPPMSSFSGEEIQVTPSIIKENLLVEDVWYTFEVKKSGLVWARRGEDGSGQIATMVNCKFRFLRDCFTSDNFKLEFPILSTTSEHERQSVHDNILKLIDSRPRNNEQIKAIVECYNTSNVKQKPEENPLLIHTVLVHYTLKKKKSDLFQKTLLAACNQPIVSCFLDAVDAYIARDLFIEKSRIDNYVSQYMTLFNNVTYVPSDLQHLKRDEVEQERSYRWSTLLRNMFNKEERP